MSEWEFTFTSALSKKNGEHTKRERFNGTAGQGRRDRNCGGPFSQRYFIEDETVSRIGPGLEAPPGTEVIDAAGKLVFPGPGPSARPRSPAVHGDLCEGHLRHGERGRARHGTTTLIEMPAALPARNPARGLPPLEV